MTGATGWFGRLTVGLLDEIYGSETPERVQAYASRTRVLRTRTGRVLPVHSIERLPELVHRDRPLQFLHFAFAVPGRAATESAAGSAPPMSSLADLVTHAVFALRPRGFCYPSSGAVHSHARTAGVAEYGRQKAADEQAFRRVAAAVGASIVMPRIFAVGGPCSPDPRRYLLGELVSDALVGAPLHLRSGRPVYRSYISLADIVGLTLTELMRDRRAELMFDACGDEIVEAAGLAQRVREVLGCPELAIIRQDAPTVGGEVRTESDGSVGSSGEDRYVGDPTVLHSLAGERGYPLAPLDEVIRQTALR